MNIVYKFTSKVTGKFYIGSKTECSIIDGNILDRNGKYYFTSSLCEELAKEFREDNMALEVLAKDIPREDLLEVEDYHQKQFNVVENPLSFNKVYALSFAKSNRKLKSQDTVANIYGETMKDIATNNRIVGRRDTKAQSLGFDNFGDCYKWILEMKQTNSFKAIDRLLGTDHFTGRTVSAHHGHNPLFITTLEDFNRDDIDLVSIKKFILNGKTLVKICEEENYPIVVVRHLLGGKDFKNLIDVEDKVAINSGFINRDSLEKFIMREFLLGKSCSNIAKGLLNTSALTCQRIIYKTTRERLDVNDFE